MEGDCGEAGEDLVERAEERRRADVEVRLDMIALVQINASWLFTELLERNGYLSLSAFQI